MAALSTGPKRVVLASALGLAFGYSSIGVASFGVFVMPLSAEFGWGRGDMSLALTMMSVAVFLLSPAAGMLLDRYGVRRVLIPSIFAFAVVIAALSLLSSHIMHYYAMYLVMAVAGVCTTPTSYSRVVVSWFDAHRGLALGFVLAGIGAGTAVIPIFVQSLTAHYGWRYAYLGLGAVICFVALPAVVAWIREPAKAVSSDGDAREESGFSFRESIASRQFQLLVASFLLLGVLTGGIMAHLVPLLTDSGVEAATAAKVASLLGVTLIGARLVTGYLLDRIFAPIVVALFLSGPVVGVSLLMLGASGTPAILAVVLIGLGIGAEMDFMSYLVSRYFGLRAFSRLYSLLYSAITVGVSIGPIVMGYSQQLSGSYGLGLKALLLSSVLAIIPFFFLGRYPQFRSAAD